MRLPVRLWYDAYIFVIVVFSGKRKVFLGPRALNDFEHFDEAFGALAIRDAVGLIGAREPAAPDAENQPAMADVIDGRSLFGQAQGLT